MWSEFLASDPEVRIRFPALPDFLSSGSEAGSTQPHEYKSGATWKKKLRLRSRKLRLRPLGSIKLTMWHLLFTTVGTNFADKRGQFTGQREWMEDGDGINSPKCCF
jgi:hypothetical protein